MTIRILTLTKELESEREANQSLRLELCEWINASTATATTYMEPQRKNTGDTYGHTNDADSAMMQTIQTSDDSAVKSEEVTAVEEGGGDTSRPSPPPVPAHVSAAAAAMAQLRLHRSPSMPTK